MKVLDRREYDSLKSPGVAHGFFGRAGGVSTGIYESLNCGPGSRDTPEAVAENRRRVAGELAADISRSLTVLSHPSGRLYKPATYGVMKCAGLKS